MAKEVKTGGRQKGTPNKATALIKAMVVDFIQDNWSQVQEDWKSKKLHPRDRLIFLEKLLKYAVPIMNNTNGVLNIKSDLEKLSEEDLELIINRLTEQNANDE